MALNRSFKLNTGATIPAIGFGTWQAPPLEVEIAVEKALRCGYRHLDCAPIYRNEAEVGKGIKNSGVKREDIFLTTKLWNTKHAPEDVEGALDQSLKDLGVEYIDLYLMHWPIAFAPGPKLFPIDSSGNFQLAEIHAVDTYKAMEKLLNTGKVKAIGVSNMNISRLKFLLSKVAITPAANQIESHPYLQQPELLSFCRSSGILVQAYSPLGNNVKGLPRAVDDPRVQAIAKRIGKEPGQLLICWGVQRGTNVLSKSVSQHRIEANFQDFVLANDLMAELESMDENRRLNGQLHWGIDPFDEVDQETVQSFARDAAPANKLKFVT